MKRALMLASAAAAALTVSSVGQAAVVIVDALGNSSSGGTGATTGLSFTLGDALSVAVAGSDLWSAGPLPRWSDANGLTGNTFATGSDESGEAAGTQIGADFGLHMQDGFSAPFGSLVGKIGSSYQILGTNFNGTAWDTGSLSLFYWDSNNGDNFGSISASISAIPEPTTWALMLFGFGLAGYALRRRSSQTVRTSVRYA